MKSILIWSSPCSLLSPSLRRPTEGLFRFFYPTGKHDKVMFLDYVKSQGYTAYLYFIATESPVINVERVKNRVAKRSHDVPEEYVDLRRQFDQLIHKLNAFYRYQVNDGKSVKDRFRE